MNTTLESRLVTLGPKRSTHQPLGKKATVMLVDAAVKSDANLRFCADSSRSPYTPSDSKKLFMAVHPKQMPPQVQICTQTDEGWGGKQVMVSKRFGAKQRAGSEGVAGRAGRLRRGVVVGEAGLLACACIKWCTWILAFSATTPIHEVAWKSRGYGTKGVVGDGVVGDGDGDILGPGSEAVRPRSWIITAAVSG